jgi:hypothetical protein
MKTEESTMAVAPITGVIVIVLSLGPQGNRSEQGWNKEIPELAVLDQWTGSVESRSETPSVRTGSARGVWTVDGRFMRQDWTIDPAGDAPRFSGSALMTYDPAGKVYRSWSFQSNGVVVESEGKWDESKRTLTWISKPTSEGTTVETTAQFAGDGSERWKIVIKDRAGEPIFETTGRNTPPKK